MTPQVIQFGDSIRDLIIPQLEVTFPTIYLKGSRKLTIPKKVTIADLPGLFCRPKTTFFFPGKVALVDTSHEKFQDLYTAALTKELDLSTLDYLIVSHTEPDHSGSSIQGEKRKESMNLF